MSNQPKLKIVQLTTLEYAALNNAEQGVTGGWFWQVCSPESPMTGEAYGPFDTKKEAVEDSRQTLEE